MVGWINMTRESDKWRVIVKTTAEFRSNRRRGISWLGWRRNY